jgi:predicted GNAT superfamily acetyltransferase
VLARLRDPHSTQWADEIDVIRGLLGAPDNPALFPPHFLKSTFPEIGGELIEFFDGQTIAGFGFLFPRTIEHGRRVYTLRLHRLPGPEFIYESEAKLLAEALLPNESVIVFDPAGDLDMPGSVLIPGDVAIVRPNAREAEQLRALQGRIWGSGGDLLYPSDIHSTGFGAGTSLIARWQDQVAGFLFGFMRFGGPALPGEWQQVYRTDLRLESQVLGADPDIRGKGVGSKLKRAQAELARQLGLDVVSWTVDPLQMPNALLNFASLGAVCTSFHPNWYAFQNELNQVPASRLSMTWLINSERVVNDNRSERLIDLTKRPDIVRMNDGSNQIADPAELGGALCAIEIPGDWTGLQSLDYERAWFWRQTTDRLLLALLGSGDDRYMITSVARDGERAFLVAERTGDVVAKSTMSFAKRPQPARIA